MPNSLPSIDPGAIRLALVGEAPGADEAALGQPFCLDASTLVLTADFLWKPLIDIQVGDKLMTVDEHAAKGAAGISGHFMRRWRIATVLAMKVSERDCIRIESPDGFLIGTADHRVLIRTCARGDYQWKMMGELWCNGPTKKGHSLVKAAHLWTPRLDWEAGYLAGIFDGEGHVLGSQLRNPKFFKCGSVAFSQNQGEVEQHTLMLLQRSGFACYTGEKSRSKTGVCMRHTIAGGTMERMRFLGTIRPRRLMKDYVRIIESGQLHLRNPKSSKLNSKQAVGIRQVVDITTTTGTFIANGFVVHNCGKSGWWLNQWLASAGISRHSCFVGNVCQMRPSPTSNDFHELEWHSAQVQEGVAALRDDLRRFKPNIVVALGNAALHLLRHGNIGPPKSQKKRLFQWFSHVGVWRGSLFLGASDFDPLHASDLRFREGRCPSGTPLNQPPAAQRGTTTPADFANAKPAASSNRAADLAARGASFSGALQDGAPPSGAPSTGESSSRSSSASSEGSPITLANRMAKGDAHAPISVDRANVAEVRSLGVQVSNPAPVSAFKTIATYHPAATFREPSFVFPLVSDLKRAVAEARSPELVLPPRHIRWGLPTEELEHRVECIRRARLPVGFDIEGGLGGLQLASIATSPSEAFVIDLMGECFERPRVLAALASVLEDASVPKVCWNAAYERAVLECTASIRLAGYEDGMLAWWERFSELPKGLDFVASILTREPYWAEGIGWDKKTGAPRVTGPPFYTYNALDSMVTLEIWQTPLIRAVAESRTPVAFTL